MECTAKEVKDEKLIREAARNNGTDRITLPRYIARRKTALAKSNFGYENVTKAYRLLAGPRQ